MIYDVVSIVVYCQPAPTQSVVYYHFATHGVSFKPMTDRPTDRASQPTYRPTHSTDRERPGTDRVPRSVGYLIPF